ncbi:MAG: DEAD/DEAH box helicase [Oligoflexia bacterium]|nr:DEAD/DEAH box helicase [Oligoflexia bacterium]
MSICGQDSFANKKWAVKWAVIDIETTGIDYENDSIIEIGFVVFNGSKIAQKFQTFVRYEGELSFFIKSLTGIDEKLLKKAPPLEENLVAQINELLEGAVLVAHNSDFEKRYLKKYITNTVEYVDSIPFLALLFPNMGQFSLENFLIELGITNKESHRGLEDSLDLLKVLLLTLYDLHNDLHKNTCIERRDSREQVLKLFRKYNFENHFYYQLLEMSVSEIMEIASSIDFDLDLKYREWKEKTQVDSEYKDEVECECNEECREISLEFSGKNIESILQDTQKIIASKIPSYKYREPQKTLALKVGQSFKNNVHAIIEAPTGSGKTLGYLLPSALFALDDRSEKKQILVATGTKALQKQVYYKDIPNIKKILNAKDLKVVELFGSNNHLCELSFKKFDESGDLFFSQKSFEERFSFLYLSVIFEYNASRIEDMEVAGIRGLQEKGKEKKYALIDDLPYAVKSKIDFLNHLCKTVAVDFRTCISHKCLYKDRCSYLHALKCAKTADIIIGNHALMFKWPRVLELPSYIVVDEAHKIEGEVTNAFTLTLSDDDLKSFSKSLATFFGIGPLFFLLSQEKYFKAVTEFANSGSGYIDISEMTSSIKKETEGLSFELDGYISKLSEVIPLYFQGMPKYSEYYWNELPMITFAERNSENKITIYDTLNEIYQQLFEYYKKLSPCLLELGKIDFTAISDLEAFARFKAFMINLEDILRTVSFNLNILESKFRKELLDQYSFNSADDSYEGSNKNEKINEKINEKMDASQYVNSIKYNVEYGFVFESAPINVGVYVYKGLLENARSVVFTSATLTRGGSSAGGQNGAGAGTEVAEWYLGYTYLPPQKRFKNSFVLPPIFDYKKDARVLVCSDVLNFYDSRFVGDTLKEVIPLIKDIGGKSLILFSSKQRFEDAREVLLKSFNGVIPLFVQGMGSRIVEEYKKSTCGVLLGMESFGEGIDLPGDSLQFLFVDKVPDLRMDLIIQERRKFFDRNFGDEFLNYFMFKRALSLRQKLGRLLRTDSDIGAAIVVDARVKQWKKNTIDNFKELMSPYDLQFINLRAAVQESLKFILQKK